MALAGVAVGAAAGAWVARKLAQPRTGSTPNLEFIDWDRVRSIAVGMNRGEALTATQRLHHDAEYTALGERCIPLIEGFTGDTLPAAARAVAAFDRIDWINANIEAFKLLLAPFEEMGRIPAGSSPAATAIVGTLNRSVVSGEVGLLLGYLARRVLGQYDMSLLGKEPLTVGTLYYVQPNIEMVERTLSLPSAEFRLWLALHETTHAFEFEAHPWVKQHFNEMLTAYLNLMKNDAEQFRQSVAALRTMAGRLKEGRREDLTWIESLMTPEQRALFNRIQALMCVLEGYSNFIMNAVGRDLMPSYDRIVKAFESRQKNKSAVEQLFARLTGLNLKMEQYRLGEIFVTKVYEQRGLEGVQALWRGPEALPTMEEIRDPAAWMSRVLA